MYGNIVFFLDGIYRIIKYSFFFFMVVVWIYVEYILVVEFVIEVNKLESIKEVLYILKFLNLDCWFGDIMLDYSEVKINVVKIEFEFVKILFCVFYRE